MKIETIGQLKKLISSMDDDFKLEINIMTEIPEEELINSRYPYPWRKIDGYIEYHDTGYSDKVVCFGIYQTS
jgi:hypothetical protein